MALIMDTPKSGCISNRAGHVPKALIMDTPKPGCMPGKYEHAGGAEGCTQNWVYFRCEVFAGAMDKYTRNQVCFWQVWLSADGTYTDTPKPGCICQRNDRTHQDSGVFQDVACLPELRQLTCTRIWVCFFRKSKSCAGGTDKGHTQKWVYARQV